MRSAADLWEELLLVDESTSIEAKTSRDVGRSLLETVCAFSNEPGLGGGYLLLGVRPSQQGSLFGPSYEVVGVDEPDKLQVEIAGQCRQVFNHPVRPQLAVERLAEKNVVVVFVPELAPTEKPLFLKALGLPRGAFRRVGSTDQEGTEDDLIALYQGHQGETYDGAVVGDAAVDDLDPDAIRVYRELRRAANPVAEELTWSDADLLRAVGAVTLEDGAMRPTVAGVLLFGKAMALRRCFPMMRIDYVRIPGREWVSDPDRRFDTIEIRDPLLLAARRAIAAVRDDLPASFRLPEGSAMRTDDTILPLRVLREAIVNAVMHRSYRIHGAIQILRYANRLEVRNPGHSLKADERLGDPGSETRNPRIAAVLHDVHLAETKGSGIRAMREVMQQHDLLPPTFESTRRPDQFVATFLFHHFLEESDLAWLGTLTPERLSDEESRALIFVREVGAIDNAAYRNLNRVDTLTASGHLRRLRDLHLLEMKGAGSKTYYVAGTGVVAGDVETHKPDAETHKPDVQTHKPDLQTHKPGPQTHKVALPEGLEERIAHAGQRPPASVVEALVVALCAHRPSSAREIAEALGGRDVRHLTRTYLRPLIARGLLAYTIPQMPKHPDQKYTTPPPPTAEDAAS